MTKLKDYFNRKTFCGIAPGSVSIVGTATAGLLVYSGSIPALALAVVIGTITAGYVNKWQEAATGRPFWTPRTPFFGL